MLWPDEESIAANVVQLIIVRSTRSQSWLLVIESYPYRLEPRRAMMLVSESEIIDLSGLPWPDSPIQQRN